jgi:hypothetical protein
MAGSFAHVRIPCTMTTGATQTTGVFCGGFKYLAIECPTFSVGFASANVAVYCYVAASDLAASYKPLFDLGMATSGAVQQWTIPAGVGNFIAPVDSFQGFAYVKFGFSSGTTAATFTPAVHLSVD